jgi:hypothetical protein
MAEITSTLEKEIDGKTAEGTKYTVVNLKFSNVESVLSGTVVINKRRRNFYMDFENSAETEYNYVKVDNHVKVDAEVDFKDALSDFYKHHIIEFEHHEIDENENIHITRTIRLL